MFLEKEFTELAAPLGTAAAHELAKWGNELVEKYTPDCRYTILSTVSILLRTGNSF
jgi:hypothetical protein